MPFMTSWRHEIVLSVMNKDAHDTECLPYEDTSWGLPVEFVMSLRHALQSKRAPLWIRQVSPGESMNLIYT